jgi:thymidylate synthase (FAD)
MSIKFDYTSGAGTPRPGSAEADKILGLPIRLLNHGFVRLVDYMGNDHAIVQAARVSYGEGTKKHSEDKALIRYLMRHRHTSPFEMVEAKFHIKAPIFVARQWVRHRTASINEVSARYSILPEEYYIPEDAQISFQSTDNKQGRAVTDVPQTLKDKVKDMLLFGQREAHKDYEAFLEAEIARELARINLPVSIYTEWYWKMNLHNLFHFLSLRLDAHAQYEIRVYAEALLLITRKIVPLATIAFLDYVHDATTLSAYEFEIIRAKARGEEPGSDLWAAMGSRERKEFIAKWGLKDEVPTT